MKKASVLVALLGIVSSLSAICISQAEAALPIRRADCFTPGRAGAMGRQMGERNAARLANAVWMRLGQTCNNVDRLAQILSETPLARPYQGGEFAACFYLGYTEQLFNSLDDTYNRCGSACFTAGAEIGRISAQGYCAASLAVGGLYDPGFISQPPLPFCGSSLVMGCKSEYVAVASWEFPGCSMYTQGHFADTFDNTVRQDCYVPADVPIRDSFFDRFGI